MATGDALILGFPPETSNQMEMPRIKPKAVISLSADASPFFPTNTKLLKQRKTKFFKKEQFPRLVTY